MTAGISKIVSLNYRLSNIASPWLVIVIALNVAIFLILAVSSLVTSVHIADTLSLEPTFTGLIKRPWTIITYSFTQANVLQLLFNMLWLYSFGRLFTMCRPDRELLFIYLSGAILGGIAFLIFSSVLGSNASGWLMGSSAAVIAVAVAVAMIMPDKELDLPLIGPTKIKWIVAVVVVLFCIGLSTPNAGGNLAHLGGAGAGAVSSIIIRHGKSTTGSNEYAVLVEKIKRSGYEALSSREKRRFFELSSRRNSR